MSINNINNKKIIIIVLIVTIAASISVNAGDINLKDIKTVSNSNINTISLFDISVPNIIVRIDISEGDVILPKDIDVILVKPNQWLEAIMPLTRLFELSKYDINYSISNWNFNSQSNLVRGDYHSLSEMENILINISLGYPNITSLFSIGTTYEGRDIWCLEITDNPGVEEEEPGILFTGLHHAREWPTVEICLYIAENLTSNYTVNSTINNLVNNRRIWIVPCVNPDGYYYCHDLGNDWRKNRNYFLEFGTFGVDLNRNYGGSSNGNILGEWGSIGNAYTATDHTPSSSTYVGPMEFSENETKAISNLIINNDISAVITWHTHGELVIWPWAYSLTDTTPDNVYLSNVGTEIASRITQQDGTGTYDPGQSSTLYPTTGDTTDWVYGYSHYVIGKPTFAYTIEACSSFQPSNSYLDQICKENYDGGLYLIEEAENISNIVPRVISPIIDEILDPSNNDYNISWNEKNPKANPEYFQLDELTNLSLTMDNTESGMDLWDVEGFTLSTTQNYSGEYSYKSRSENYDVSSITTKYPIPINEGVNLSFWCWYDIEDNYDMGFVEVSQYGRDYEIIDKFNGDSNGWVYKEYDLSNYNNESIFIRFRYTTDSGVLNEGLYIDDIYPVANFSTVINISGSITDHFYNFIDKVEGIYYYRVRGYNLEHGWGDYSSLRKVNVTGPSNSIIISEINSIPCYQENVGWVNITCNVTSLGEVDIVQVNITNPDLTQSNYYMNKMYNADIFYFNSTFSQIGKYVFNIWANDTLNNQTESDNHIFYIGQRLVEIDLNTGWNMITIPVENNWMASTLAENISGCQMVGWFDAVNQELKTHVVAAPIYDFPITNGYGYFVLVGINSLFEVYNIEISSVSVQLNEGWNMIGWYSNKNTSASSLAENITGCQMIGWFDSTSQELKTHVVAAPVYDFDIISGMGLFILTNTTSTWNGEG